MASRRGIAGSIAAAIVFSSLLVSNFSVYAGAAQNFRLVSLSTEERAYLVQAKLATAASVFDLLEGAQEILSSSHFECSEAISAVAESVGSESVRLGQGGLAAYTVLSLAPDVTSADNLTSLRPFDGALAGTTNLAATVRVQGSAADGSIRYYRTEQHLLNLPLRIRPLTTDCLLAEARVAGALSGLGASMCNASALFAAMAPVTASLSSSASADGFALSVSYGITPGPHCGVDYWITAGQSGIRGPEGVFAFTEIESGSVEA